MKKKLSINELVGANIKRIRREFGLTQEQLADAVDMNRVSIVNIEKGVHCTTVDKLVDICSILCCTPNDIFPPIPKSAAQRTPVTITFKSPKARKECLRDPVFVNAMNRMVTKAFYTVKKK